MENIGSKTIVTSGISSSYAAGKMAGENSNELDIFVEDNTAKNLIEIALSNETRLQVNVLVIGSSSAVTSQLTARYKNIKEGECIAILDGDKRIEITSLCHNFIKMLESVDDKDAAESYIKDRLKFLPGSTWPEKWIFSEIKQKYVAELAAELSVDEASLNGYLDEAIRSGKHNEFYTMGKKNHDVSGIKTLFCRSAVKCNKDEFGKIEESILELIPKQILFLHQ